MTVTQTRRSVLASLAAIGWAGLLGTSNAVAEPAPETSRVRLPLFAKITDCETPLYIAADFLRAEGLTDVTYVESGSGPVSEDWIANGEIDFDWNFPPVHIEQIQKGVPIKVLAGLHAGCLELIATDGVQGIADLKGKRIGIDRIGSNAHKLTILMTTYIGFDPQTDFEWVKGKDVVAMFTSGQIDAFLGTPPQPQIMRERKLGHAILSTAIDRPWSQYFCCMLAGSNEYVSKYPIATKRTMRALLKAVDFCVSDPENAALASVSSGRSSTYAIQAVRSDIRYDKWREYDPEDTIRFYALRMQETGMITASPHTIVAQGTKWGPLQELKRELKL